MATLIPRKIGDNEILVRYIFDKNFRNKKIKADKLDIRNVFLPHKGGVSLQRSQYISETTCKTIAKSFRDRKYVGFMIFKKATFLEEKEAYILNSRKDFRAEIVATPLNKALEKVPDGKKVYVESSGQPAHADLIYINPAQQGEESPKTAIRSFSRKLAKQAKLILDSKPHQKSYWGIAFKEMF